MCIERDNNSSINVHGCVYASERAYASEKCAYAFSLALVLDLVLHFHMSLVLVLGSKADLWLV
jgi:hypothetical protein